MTETTTVPPERCPVCGAAIVTYIGSQLYQKNFECGAQWLPRERDRWNHLCPHAMTACLRTGATLAPTAAEQARDALVAAAVARWEAMPDDEPIRERDWDFCLAAKAYHDLAAAPPPVPAAVSPRPDGDGSADSGRGAG